MPTIGEIENQQATDFGLYSAVSTNTATPTVIRRFTPKIGEAGAIEIRYNAVSAEATPRHVNRVKWFTYKRASDGTVTVTPVVTPRASTNGVDNVLLEQIDAGGNAVNIAITAENFGDVHDVVYTVTGVAGME